MTEKRKTTTCAIPFQSLMEGDRTPLRHFPVKPCWTCWWRRPSRGAAPASVRPTDSATAPSVNPNLGCWPLSRT